MLFQKIDQMVWSMTSFERVAVAVLDGTWERGGGGGKWGVEGGGGWGKEVGGAVLEGRSLSFSFSFTLAPCQTTLPSPLPPQLHASACPHTCSTLTNQ